MLCFNHVIPNMPNIVYKVVYLSEVNFVFFLKPEI